MNKNKPIIGILGGIGAGKSTVAHVFARVGCVVIDADALAHQVLDLAAVKDAIVGHFGKIVLDNAGRVDRAVLAERVFEQPEEIAFLNGLVHPAVLKRTEELIAAYRDSEKMAGIVLDMPLLLEVGWEKKCDFLVFVECERPKRVERMLKNGKIDENQLKKRENYQISLDKKRQIADYIIHNNSDESDIAEQIAQFFSNIAKSN